MTVEELIQLCTEWARLGGAVQDQAFDVLVNDAPVGDQNPNAMQEVLAWLESAAWFDVDGATFLHKQLREALS